MFKQLQSFEIYLDAILIACALVDLAEEAVVAIACIFGFQSSDLFNQPTNLLLGSDSGSFKKLNLAVGSHRPESGVAQTSAHCCYMRLKRVIHAERHSGELD